MPSLDLYLTPFVQLHHKALVTAFTINPNNRLLEDYLMLYDSLYDLVYLSEEDFLGVFRKTFNPMVQIAENMGFKYWKNPTI